MDVGTRDVSSRSDVHKKASIELHPLTLAPNDMRKDGRDAPVLLAVGKLERYADWGAVSINRRRYQDGVSQV